MLKSTSSSAVLFFVFVGCMHQGNTKKENVETSDYLLKDTFSSLPAIEIFHPDSQVPLFRFEGRQRRFIPPVERAAVLREVFPVKLLYDDPLIDHIRPIQLSDSW